MRIGLVIYGDLETLSGGYLYDRRLVEHLRRQGDEVEIVSLPWRGYLRHLTDNLSGALLDRLAAADYDALLQDELNHPSLAWLNGRLRRRARYPLLAIVHHPRSCEVWPAWQRRLFAQVERRYLRSLDGLICNSGTTRRAALALAGRALPAVVAWPGGDRFGVAVADEEIARRAAEPGPLRLLFVGNVIRRKGLHTLLAALACLDPATWRLTVAGSLTAAPRYSAAIRRQIAGAGLAGAVELLGAVDDDRLAALFAESHLLAAPSSYEGFGIAALEGMGFGLPAIGTTAGAAGELIADGVTGYLVAPDDAVALAGRIAALHLDREHLATMGQAARQRYAAHPTWEQTAARIRQFLVEVVG